MRINKSFGLQHIITARIRSMTGRYCFHRCLSVNISGGVPGLRFSGGGGTWSQISGGGYLVSENCYGYMAGGMPLAFTQEDFLV